VNKITLLPDKFDGPIRECWPAGLLQALGHYKIISFGSACLLLANATTLAVSHSALDGPMLPIVKILRRVQWSHARLACKSLQVMIGQLSLLGKEHPIKCWPLQASCSAAIQLATDYEGPVAAAAATNLTGNS